jgi:hypothetical protein
MFDFKQGKYVTILQYLTELAESDSSQAEFAQYLKQVRQEQEVKERS